MNVREIRREEDLDSLQPAWNELVSQSTSGTTFLTWEWISAWWSAYGTPGDLRVLLFSDENGALRGIAPLRMVSLRRYGQTMPALSFVGYAPSECDSDYLDLIVSPGWEKEVAEAFYKYRTD